MQAGLSMNRGPGWRALVAGALCGVLATGASATESAQELRHLKADLPLFEEVYRSVHAQRTRFTVLDGLYPGMSRQALIDYASRNDATDAEIFPESLVTMGFTVHGNTRIVASFVDNDVPYQRRLRQEGRKPDDHEIFAERIEVVRSLPSGELDAEAVIAQTQEEFGPPSETESKAGYIRLVYRLGDVSGGAVAGACEREIGRVGDREARLHARPLGQAVGLTHPNLVLQALQACPNVEPLYRDYVAGHLGPVMDMRVFPKQGRVVYLLEYPAGHTFRTRYALRVIGAYD